jgi:tetratricopeptide (TPR) repeat protein
MIALRFLVSLTNRVCYGLIEEPGAAMKEYEKAYKKGHEQWEQSCQEIERLRSLAFGRGKSSANEMANRLGDFYQQFLEPLKKLIENRPPTSDNAASTSYSTVGEFQLLTLKSIPGSKKEIRKLYASGENHRLAGRYNEAIDNYSRVFALSGGNHAEALGSRGEVKHMLKDYKGALHDMNRLLQIKPNSA